MKVWEGGGAPFPAHPLKFLVRHFLLHPVLGGEAGTGVVVVVVVTATELSSSSSFP